MVWYGTVVPGPMRSRHSEAESLFISLGLSPRTRTLQNGEKGGGRRGGLPGRLSKCDAGLFWVSALVWILRRELAALLVHSRWGNGWAGFQLWGEGVNRAPWLTPPPKKGSIDTPPPQSYHD